MAAVGVFVFVKNGEHLHQPFKFEVDLVFFLRAVLECTEGFYFLQLDLDQLFDPFFDFGQSERELRVSKSEPL